MASSKAKVGVTSETNSLKESKSNASSSAEDASPNNRTYCLDDLETVATVGELTTTFDLSMTVRVSHLRFRLGVPRRSLTSENLFKTDELKNIKLESHLDQVLMVCRVLQSLCWLVSVIVTCCSKEVEWSFAGVFSNFLCSPVIVIIVVISCSASPVIG